MRLSLSQIMILLIMTGVSFAATTNAQEMLDRKLTLQVENQSLKEILKEIESIIPVKFAYSKEAINSLDGISIRVNGEKLRDVLDKLLTPRQIHYQVIGEQIILNPDLNPGKESGTEEDIRNHEVIEDIITGSITSEKGEPLPGVNVILKGTQIGTVTNADGKYSLALPDLTGTLIFSYIGYKSMEVPVNGRTIIDVSLTEELQTLDEVVVVGYGTMKKSDLTGAVSSVSAEALTAYPSLNAIQSLQGRAAGVQIQANNGEPGASYKVRIRGATSINSSSDPLYVVDGFPGAAMPPPEDIESIEILKDASATAIYGSRGANGVIMITTKHGDSGRTKIEFHSSYSFQKEMKRLDLLTKDDFMDYAEEARPGVLESTLIGDGTDWQEEILRPGNTQNYSLSLRGGNENVKYYVSGILYDQQGIILSSDYKRYSFTTNVEIKASEKFNFGVNIFGKRSVENGVSTQENSGGTSNTGVISSAFKSEPTLPVYDPDGNYTISFLNTPNDNPVAIVKERLNESVSDLLQANFFGQYAIAKGLTFRVNAGAVSNNGRTGNYFTSRLLRAMDLGGEGSLGGNKNTTLINENYLTYNKSFGNHTVTVIGGYSYEATNNENWSGASQGYLTDAFDWWDLDGGATYVRPSSGLTKTALSSFYGRVNYKFLDRYLLTISSRYDGSSRFAKNNKWAFFPSGALAWDIADESFMESIPAITQLKLRASYGVTGNQGISPYQSLATLRTATSVVNSALVNAIVPNTVANNNLTWESTQQTDIGLDLGLFAQRLVLTADYYDKKTSDLLFSVPLPEYSGYTSLLKNTGKIRNSGFEFALSSVNLDGKVKWTSDFNISFNRNKVLELPGDEDILYNSSPGHFNIAAETTGILREGEPVGVFYGYVFDGIIQEGEAILPGNFEQAAGGERFKDLTGEGEISSDDRTIIGNPNPDFIWGFSNSLKFKNFDLNFFFQGSQGNDIYSWTLEELEIMRGDDNSTTEALKRWTPTNTDTNVPNANTARKYHSYSRFIFDGGFTRLRNLSLGYTLPSSMSKSIAIQLLRVYVSAQNVLTISDYRGYDPEVNYRSSGNVDSNRNLGYDYGSYPMMKSVTVGLNLTF